MRDSKGGFVLRLGAYYYVGKCFRVRKRWHAGLTGMRERARVYTTRANAMRGQNALMEKTGAPFEIEEA